MTPPNPQNTTKTGPGGVLGVLPAVELHAWDKALLYLFSFCLTSIVVCTYVHNLSGI